MRWPAHNPDKKSVDSSFWTSLHLEYIVQDVRSVYHLQGRVACEINSGDELASTELIFGGVLTQLTPEEAVAVLSALVFQVSCP